MKYFFQYILQKKKAAIYKKVGESFFFIMNDFDILVLVPRPFIDITFKI